MNWVFNDGGRAATGRKGTAGDCVVRAVAIATEQPYDVVYKAFADINANTRSKMKGARRHSARNGVAVKSVAFKRYMKELGWTWTPTMLIGQGCTTHLVENELPKGRLIVSLSRHYSAIIDSVIHDTYDPQRGATTWYKPGSSEVLSVSPDRCVYGYWQPLPESPLLP